MKVTDSKLFIVRDQFLRLSLQSLFIIIQKILFL
jgi:hypothetical protein